MSRLCLKNLKGSLTVEAAFIMPLVIAVLFFLLFLGLYLYDACLVNAVTGEACAFSANEIRCGYTADESTCENTAATLLKGKPVFLQTFFSEGSVDEAVSLTSTGERKSGSFLSAFTGRNPWELSCSYQSLAASPEGKIRLAFSITEWKALLSEESSDTGQTNEEG